MFVKNNKYEILTPDGWKDFDGVDKKPSKQLTYKVLFEDNTFFIATNDHTFFSNDKKIKVKDMSAGDFIDCKIFPKKISEIKKYKLEDVYDIINVNNDKHKFIINNCFYSKNCDELAFVPGNQAEDFWSANYPTISASKKSKIIVISTPNGLFNLFHKIYLESTIEQNSFVNTKVSWEGVPGRDEEWATEQVKNLGKRQFAQEFAVEFIGSTNTLIEPGTLEVILNQSEEPIHEDLAGRLRLWEKPEKGAIYIIGCDPAKGTGENYSTGQILKLLSVVPIKLKQVGVFHDNMTDVYDYSDILVRLATYYNKAYLLVENNGEGSAVVNRIWWEHEYENLVNSGSKTANLGIRSTGGAKSGTKPKAVLLMKKLIEDGSLRIFDERTLKELGSFIEENGRFFGKDTHDDLVSAMFWGCYFLEMDVLDENYEFLKKDEGDDIWGVLSDLDEIVEDWSWLSESDALSD